MGPWAPHKNWNFPKNKGPKSELAEWAGCARFVFVLVDLAYTGTSRTSTTVASYIHTQPTILVPEGRPRSKCSLGAWRGPLSPPPWGNPGRPRGPFEKNSMFGGPRGPLKKMGGSRYHPIDLGAWRWACLESKVVILSICREGWGSMLGSNGIIFMSKPPTFGWKMRFGCNMWFRSHRLYDSESSLKAWDSKMNLKVDGFENLDSESKSRDSKSTPWHHLEFDGFEIMAISRFGFRNIGGEPRGAQGFSKSHFGSKS